MPRITKEQKEVENVKEEKVKKAATAKKTSSSKKTDAKKVKVEAKKSKKEVDVIKDLAKENNIELSSVIKDFGVKSCDKTTAETKTTGGKYDAVIIVAIFVVLVGGFAGLVVLGKK